MSRSTTATTTHILLKYSRSYPSDSDQGEWEHYVNPVMRLVLDVKKSVNSELESVRLRILWSMNGGGGMMGAGQEVVFEDLDLLSFSTPPSQLSQTVGQNQGLPLKAVYRDAVVGIRYFWRLGSANSPGTYRRFQITFQSSTAASQFIDAIRYVCPCKVNPNPVVPRTGNMIPAPAQVPVPPLQKNMLAPLNSSAYSQVSRPPIINSATPVVPKPTPHFMAPLSQTEAPSSTFPLSDFDNSSRPTTSSSAVLPSSGGNLKRAWNSDLPLVSEGMDSQPAPRPTEPENLSNSSSSSSNGRNCNIMPPPSHIPSSGLNSQIAHGFQCTLAQEAEPKDSHDVVSALLRESPRLYDLSRTELEKLVGEVVREDGFLKLLENLDNMWKMKGFLAK